MLHLELSARDVIVLVLLYPLAQAVGAVAFDLLTSGARALRDRSRI